jgi:UDP-N-acetylglucosamine diphosphorylase/glucosamine-1-phosphate N-acetyltransferase
MRICLFEDCGVTQLEPLTLTRAAFELLCGQTSLCSKQCRFFAPCEVGVLIRPALADLFRLQHPALPVNDLAWLRAGPAVMVNSRWLPPADGVATVPDPCVAMIGEDIAFAVVGPERLTYCSANTLDDCLETWKHTLPRHPAGGRLIHYLWDLVEGNGRQLQVEFERCTGGRLPGSPPPMFAVVGPESRLFLDPTALIDPMVVVDTTRGPVVIDQEAVVTAFSRLEGPCYVGPHTHLLGAKLRAGTTLGPHCRIGGEVEASIVQGYTNKYHDGFLGHSYLGEWINLGAGTHNSDLRNDYGPVSVTVAGAAVATGLTKVGCFLGDHTKTGLGTLLNTGTNAGAFCNLLPAGGLLPKYIPSFASWWNGVLRDACDLPALLDTAATVMERRGWTLTQVHTALYRGLYDRTAAERRRLLAPSGPRPLRRSA